MLLFCRFSCLAILCSLVLLSACGKKGVEPLPPPPPPPSVVRVEGLITAADTLNPDVNGRSSPVIVRIYQLRSDAAFRAADFFALYEEDAETLADDLVVRDEKSVQYGERLVYGMEVSEGVRFVAAFAAFSKYQDGDANWRSISELPVEATHRKPGLTTIPLLVELDGVTVKVVTGKF